MSPPRHCSRCRTELGLIMNRGAPCPGCRQRVCKNCRQYGNGGRDWVCIVCHKQIELQIATGEWMNQYAKGGSGSPTTPIRGDLLAPSPSSRLPPTELIRRTLARRSFAGPASAEVPNTFVVPPLIAPKSSLSSSSTPSKDGGSKAPPQPPSRRYSLGSADSLRKRNGNSPSTATSTNSTNPSPSGKPESPVQVSAGTSSSRPRSPGGGHSPSPARRSPLPGRASSPHAGLSSPRVGEPSISSPSLRRRQLPQVPPVTPIMRDKLLRNSHDPDRLSFGDARRSPFSTRNPPDGSSAHSTPGTRSADGYLPSDLSRDYVYRPNSNREVSRSPGHDLKRKPQNSMPPTPLRGQPPPDFIRHQSDFSRSQGNLPSGGRRRPESLHLSQDSFDNNPFHDYRGGDGGGEPGTSQNNYRSSACAYPSSHQQHQSMYPGVPSIRVTYPRSNPDLHASDQHQQFEPRTPTSPGINSPSYSATPTSPVHPNPPPSKPNRSSTLPRRPHSTHGDPTLSQAYQQFGSLPRPNHYHSSHDDPMGFNIQPQPSRDAPTTVNQILYGNGNPPHGPKRSSDPQTYSSGGQTQTPTSTSGGYTYDTEATNPSGEGHSGGKGAPYLTSGYATTGRSRKINRTVEGLRRSKSFHNSASDDRPEPTGEDSGSSCPKDPSARGSVAKYVQELERGIKYTVTNMMPKKVTSTNLTHSESFNVPPCQNPTVPGKDLKYSHSFKYPSSESSNSKNPNGITHSQSFKYSNNSKDLGHGSSDRYRPYTQPRRTPSMHEYSSNYSADNRERYPVTPEEGLALVGPRESKRDVASSTTRDDQTTVESRSRSPRRSITNEIINSESLELLKKYSQESPTWCGVDRMANRRWDRHANTPNEPIVSSSWKSPDNLEQSSSRRHSSDDILNAPLQNVASPDRHSFYDVAAYRIASPCSSPSRVGTSATPRRPLSDATLGELPTVNHERMAPEGDDYKLVFISSDSSKGSELNTSLESEGTPANGIKIAKANSFHGKPRNIGTYNERVDASVNTELGYCSYGEDSLSDGEGTFRHRQKRKDRICDRKSRRSEQDLSPERKRSSSQHSRYDPSQPPPRPPKPSHLSFSTGNSFFPPIGAIHPRQLHAMLQQTEAVQAEALALQAVFMGAFSPTERPKSSASVDNKTTSSRFKSNASSKSVESEPPQSVSKNYTIPIIQTDEFQKPMTPIKKNVSTAHITDDRKSRDITVNIQNQPLKPADLKSSLKNSSPAKNNDSASFFSDILPRSFKKNNQTNYSKESEPIRRHSFKSPENSRILRKDSRNAYVQANLDESSGEFSSVNSNHNYNDRNNGIVFSGLSEKVEPKKSELGRSSSDVAELRRYSNPEDTLSFSNRKQAADIDKPKFSRDSNISDHINAETKNSSTLNPQHLLGERYVSEHVKDDNKTLHQRTFQSRDSSSGLRSDLFINNQNATRNLENKRRNSTFSSRRNNPPESHKREDSTPPTSQHRRDSNPPQRKESPSYFSSNRKSENKIDQNRSFVGGDIDRESPRIERNDFDKDSNGTKYRLQANESLSYSHNRTSGAVPFSNVLPSAHLPNERRNKDSAKDEKTYKCDQNHKKDKLEAGFKSPGLQISKSDRSMLKSSSENTTTEVEGNLSLGRKIGRDPDVIKLSEEAQRSSNYQNVIETIINRKSSKERKEEQEGTIEGSEMSETNESSIRNKSESVRSGGAVSEKENSNRYAMCQDSSTISVSVDSMRMQDTNSKRTYSSCQSQQQQLPETATFEANTQKRAVGSNKPLPTAVLQSSSNLPSSSTPALSSHLPSDPHPLSPTKHLRREPTSVAPEIRYSAGVRRSAPDNRDTTSASTHVNNTAHNRDQCQHFGGVSDSPVTNVLGNSVGSRVVEKADKKSVLDSLVGRRVKQEDGGNHHGQRRQLEPALRNPQESVVGPSAVAAASALVSSCNTITSNPCSIVSVVKSDTIGVLPSAVETTVDTNRSNGGGSSSITIRPPPRAKHARLAVVAASKSLGDSSSVGAATITGGKSSSSPPCPEIATTSRTSDSAKPSSSLLLDVHEPENTGIIPFVLPQSAITSCAKAPNKGTNQTPRRSSLGTTNFGNRSEKLSTSRAPIVVTAVTKAIASTTEHLSVSGTVCPAVSTTVANAPSRFETLSNLNAESKSLQSPQVKTAVLSTKLPKISLSSQFRSEKLRRMSSTESEAVPLEVLAGDLNGCEGVSQETKGNRRNPDEESVDKGLGQTEKDSDQDEDDDDDTNTNTTVDPATRKEKSKSELIENIDENSFDLKHQEKSDDNDEAFDDGDTASSASDTDDDTHVNRQYDVNRTSSTSDIENLQENDDLDDMKKVDVTELNSENTLKSESSSIIVDETRGDNVNILSDDTNVVLNSAVNACSRASQSCEEETDEAENSATESDNNKGDTLTFQRTLGGAIPVTTAAAASTTSDKNLCESQREMRAADEETAPPKADLKSRGADDSGAHLDGSSCERENGSSSTGSGGRNLDFGLNMRVSAGSDVSDHVKTAGDEATKSSKGAAAEASPEAERSSEAESKKRRARNGSTLEASHSDVSDDEETSPARTSSEAPDDVIADDMVSDNASSAAATAAITYDKPAKEISDSDDSDNECLPPSCPPPPPPPLADTEQHVLGKTDDADGGKVSPPPPPLPNSTPPGAEETIAAKDSMIATVGDFELIVTEISFSSATISFDDQNELQSSSEVSEPSSISSTSNATNSSDGDSTTTGSTLAEQRSQEHDERQQQSVGSSCGSSVVGSSIENYQLAVAYDASVSECAVELCSADDEDYETISCEKKGVESSDITGCAKSVIGGSVSSGDSADSSAEVESSSAEGLIEQRKGSDKELSLVSATGESENSASYDREAVSTPRRQDDQLQESPVDENSVSSVKDPFIGDSIFTFSSQEPVQAPRRTKKRSSSSEGLSSSSDIDRSDASDSADTIIERSRSDNSLRRLVVHQRNNSNNKKNRGGDDDSCRDSIDGKSRDSDTTAHLSDCTSDSIAPGSGDSETQHSDNSEEGNLVSIVSVGVEDRPARLTHGRIYIRSDSTDSDVQIKPTCIVVTGGSSGAESSEDCETESARDNKSSMRKGNRKKLGEGNDVTILEVGSNVKTHDHVMSVQVTSPGSSRNTSPARRSNVTELQNIISTTKERQQLFRPSPPADPAEPSSSLANYFTLTLGFDSPHTPRRLNKTPEVRRRTKTPERTLDEQGKSSPALSPALSPTLTPSPVFTPTPEGEASYDDKNTEESRRFERNDEGHSESENKEESMISSIEDGHNFSSGAEEFEDQDSYDHEYGEELNEDEYFNDEDYDDDDDYGFEIPQADIKNCKPPFDFTLHTIIEESCEESDSDRRPKDDEASNPDPSELEKYFFFGLGNGTAESKRIVNEESEYSDSFSESSSSIFSESLESNDLHDLDNVDPADLASSRLEQYFLTGLGAGFERQPSIRSVGEESEQHTDESGSVGSDSEGSPSPEQPRKKLRRPRGFRLGMTTRSHGYSSDRGENPSDGGGSHFSGEDGDDERKVSGEDEGSTESEEIAFDKVDGQFDTIKRRKKKKNSGDMSDRRSDSEKSEIKAMDIEGKEDMKLSEKLRGTADAEPFSKRGLHDANDRDSKDKEYTNPNTGDLSDRKYQSRDSGFIGSSDDLLKDKPDDISKSKDTKEKSSSESSIDESGNPLSNKEARDDKHADSSTRTSGGKADKEGSNHRSEAEERRRGNDGKVSRSSTGSSADLPPFSKDRIKVTRKDSFNWSSDEETNIMMNRMRAFFRNMLMRARENVKEKSTVKSPQMLLFEAKLTSLMKKVPDINDEQVKEIVEYLSSEDTWSDSYDSSDYTASDLEGRYALFEQHSHPQASELREQISASCQQIIQKFDQSREPSDTDSAHSLFGGHAYSESSEDVSPNNRETMFMYQRLLSTIGRMRPDNDRISVGSGSQGASPPLLVKVFHHIGNSLVELMHEVSGGSETGDDIDSLSGRHNSKSLKPPLFSYPDTSFESDGSPTDTEQSPESGTGTPKLSRRKALSIISERSSAEDFTSLESQRTVFASHDSPRHYTRPDSYLTPQTSVSQRSLEERGVTSIKYYVTEGNGNEPEVWQSVTIDEDKFDAREHVGVPKTRKSSKRPDTRKAKSHLSLEKIHHDDVKTSTAGERSESLGDLFGRFRTSEFSTTSSYEQLDSDSTLKASDSLDRHIGSSSSNVRLNASSRGSLTTSSRGSLATSSRGSLQGSSGPEDEEEKKPKKRSIFSYTRRSSMPDPKNNTNDRISPEVRSTTLPRSTPAQLLPTATLPRTLPSTSGVYRASPSYSYASSSSSSPLQGPSDVRLGGGSSMNSSQSSSSVMSGMGGVSTSGGSGVPRSARYHAPGYRPPPSSKRGLSSNNARKGFRNWGTSDDALGAGSQEEILPPSRGGYNPTPTHHHHPHTTPTHHHHPQSSHHPHPHPRPSSSTSTSPNNASTSSSALSTSAVSAPSTPFHHHMGGPNSSTPNSTSAATAPNTATSTPKSGTPSPVVGVRSTISLGGVGVLSPRHQSALNRSTAPGGGVGGGTLAGGGSLSSSLASSVVSCDVSSSAGDEDVERLLQLQERKRQHSLTTLGSRSESMASVCSGGGYTSVAVRGEVQLSLDYNYKEAALQCRVLQCRDLAAVDAKRNRSDPYVKVYLLPDKTKSGKRKTKVKKHTLNPTFDEVLKFPVPLSGMSSRTLWLSVWHSDMFGRNDFLGEVMVHMADVALDDGTPRWYTLQERTEPLEELPVVTSGSKGDLIIAMKFVPPDLSGSNSSLSSAGLKGSRRGRRSKGGLFVLVKEAKNLQSVRPNGTADPICKAVLLPEKGRGSKQKTAVCRKTLSPYWNHTMHFDDLSLQDLMERSLELVVWDHDRLGHSQFLGGCRLNMGRGTSFGRPAEWMDATGMERLIWEQMLERLNLWVESAIILRPYIDRPVHPIEATNMD